MTDGVEVNRTGLVSGVRLPTGRHTVIRLVGRPLLVLEVEDAFFHTASAVFLPTIPRSRNSTQEPQRVPFANDALWRELEATQREFVRTLRTTPFDPLQGGNASGDSSIEAREPGLGVALSALSFLQEHPRHHLLLAGHTDTSGGDSFNDRLSDARARCVLAVLEGDRDDFVTACREFHVAEDDAVILQFIARERGFPCDPGPGASPPAGAIRAFQRSFNDEFGARLAVDGVVGDETRGAYFDVYQDELARAAGSAERLQELRAALRFADDSHKHLGFGERFPIENPGADGFRSQLNRRVDLLFFEPADVPDLSDGEVGHLLFRSGRFQLELLDRTDIGSSSPPAEDDTGAAVDLVDTDPAEPNSGDPDAPFRTEMAIVEVDLSSDAWAFLEPFDTKHPPVGRQTLAERPVVPSDEVLV